MHRLKLLKEDIIQVKDRFPKLTFRKIDDSKKYFLSGELDICDTKGEYWDTFEIIVLIPDTYPFCIPTVIEKSLIIPRTLDRHISEEGICCLDISHSLILLSKKGIRLHKFIAEKVYPYFANQLYFRENGFYAGEEYAHYFEGIKQFYREELKIDSPYLAVTFINQILLKQISRRNDKCPCNSGNKFKNCHLASIDLMNIIGVDRLTDDLNQFCSILA